MGAGVGGGGRLNVLVKAQPYLRRFFSDSQNTQQRYVQDYYTEFHQNRNM